MPRDEDQPIAKIFEGVEKGKKFLRVEVTSEPSTEFYWHETFYWALKELHDREPAYNFFKDGKTLSLSVQVYGSKRHWNEKVFSSYVPASGLLFIDIPKFMGIVIDSCVGNITDNVVNFETINFERVLEENRLPLTIVKVVEK